LCCNDTTATRCPRSFAALAAAAVLKLGIEWTFAAGNPDIRELLSRPTGG
jgi:hypothetical protein